MSKCLGLPWWMPYGSIEVLFVGRCSACAMGCVQQGLRRLCNTKGDTLVLLFFYVYFQLILPCVVNVSNSRVQGQDGWEVNTICHMEWFSVASWAFEL